MQNRREQHAKCKHGRCTDELHKLAGTRSVVYGAMDKRNALKVLGLKEQINADVLQPLIDRELSQRRIAEELEVSPSTIKIICKKLGIKTKRGRK